MMTDEKGTGVGMNSRQEEKLTDMSLSIKKSFGGRRFALHIRYKENVRRLEHKSTMCFEVELEKICTESLTSLYVQNMALLFS
jgi:hypothetical protein